VSESDKPAEVVEETGASNEAPVEPAPEAASAEVTEPSVEEQLKERTADLQRLQAEYVNYRKRVERDRAQARTAGEIGVLRSLLTVLDDIGRAEKHGELEGGFRAVADTLYQAVKAHHLEPFGAPGDVFDPRLHDALFHAGESADVDATTIDSVVRLGYRVGDEVIRHAQVGVVDPASENPASVESEGPDGEPSGDAPDEGAPPDDRAQEE
jgi:molecular chaperone GrpE